MTSKEVFNINVVNLCDFHICADLQEGVKKVSKLMINAEEVAEIMDCSVRDGYKLIKEMIDEINVKGYITRAGRVPRKYFYERTGLEDQEGAS